MNAKFIGMITNVKSSPLPKDTTPKNPDEANGKIDGNFKQNLPGDCALLASIFALSKTQEGAQAIEDALCIVRDDNNEIIEYQVTFGGNNETYTVTQEELINAKSPNDGRQYATGDDDVTVLELAFEKCFKESDDSTLRYLVDNYGNSNSDDFLSGVNPASVSYLLTGEAIETIKTNDSKNVFERFIPVNDIDIIDSEGNPATFNKSVIYTPYATSEEGTILWLKNAKDDTVIKIDYDTFANEILEENCKYSTERTRELLDNYKDNSNSNVLIFGVPPKANVQSVDGETRDLSDNEAHAYIVQRVGDDTVTLLNSSNPTVDRFTVTKESLLNLNNYWVYATDNIDEKFLQQEVDVASALEEDYADYYPNFLNFLTTKLGTLFSR